MFILGAMVCVLGMMTACKSRTNNESTNDTLQRVAIPDHAPNIQYLQIIDSLGSFGWFEMDTLWLMYDNNYTRAVKPRYINGVPVVWLSNGENGAMEGDKLHSRRYIEYGYESHGGSYLTVSVCDVHYDGDGELIGVP